MNNDKPIEIAINAVADLFIELHNKKIIKVNEVIEGAVVSGVSDRLILKQKIIDMNVDRISEIEKQLKEKNEALSEAREVIKFYGNPNNWFKKWGHKDNWVIEGSDEVASNWLTKWGSE